jgi:hypothetical protein
MEVKHQLHAPAALSLRQWSLLPIPTGWRIEGPRDGADVVMKRKILLLLKIRPQLCSLYPVTKWQRKILSSYEFITVSD